MKNLSLYIHIPFCNQKKCNYCSFVSYCDKEDKKAQYVDCLCSEIEMRAKAYGDYYRVSSVYFGGGTPSTLDEGQFTKIMLTLKKNFKLSKHAEITIECNPESMTREKLKEYLLLGCNRISIGGQSINDKVLMAIGRRHNARQLKEAIKLARDCGFININVDMMIGLPYQTILDVKKMVRFLTRSKITHISAYSLILEKNTPLFNMSLDENVPFPTEDETIEMYNIVYSQLKKAGFYRYEVSNFSLPDFECAHNLNYWQMGEYLAFGLAGHSYLNDTRFNNTEDFSEYIEKIQNDEVPVYSVEKITLEMKREETLMLGLRTREGIDISKYDNSFGTHILKDKQKEIEFLSSRGFISLKDGHIKVCENAYYVLNSIILKLI